jgi:hypothetical protein
MRSQVKILLDKKNRTESPVVRLCFWWLLLGLLNDIIRLIFGLVYDVYITLLEILFLDEPREIFEAVLIAIDLDARLGDSGVSGHFSIARTDVLENGLHSLILLLLLLTRIICF